jgi:hypothetical protein
MPPARASFRSVETEGVLRFEGRDDERVRAGEDSTRRTDRRRQKAANFMMLGGERGGMAPLDRLKNSWTSRGCELEGDPGWHGKASCKQLPEVSEKREMRLFYHILQRHRRKAVVQERRGIKQRTAAKSCTCVATLFFFCTPSVNI